MKRKNIIFIDFNWVISYNNFRYSLKRVNNNLFNEIQRILFVENIELVRWWMKWQYSSEEICGIVAESLWEDKLYLYNILVADSKDLDVSESIILKLKKLKKYYKIILITDNMDCFSRWIVPSHQDLFDVFDDIFDSSKVWFFKNENNWKIFIDYVEKYWAQIENSILIDDSKNNCNSFVWLWGIAYQTKWEDNVIKQLSLIGKKTE